MLVLFALFAAPQLMDIAMDIYRERLVPLQLYILQC